MATEEWELQLPEEDAYDYEFEFDLENPFTSPADEPIASLLDAEGHHAPSVSAAASAARRDAVAFISKVRGCPHAPPHSLSLLSGFSVWDFRCSLTRSASIGPGALRRRARRAPARRLPRAQLRGSLPLQAAIGGEDSSLARDGVYSLLRFVGKFGLI